MAKRLSDAFQPKITRNDRFAQMSHQEKIIEQKKREIQAKFDAKQKQLSDTSKTNTKETCSKDSKSATKTSETNKALNTFSNDGSFLDQFKQLKEKRLEQKLKSFKNRDGHDRIYGDERGHKVDRWNQRMRSASPKDRSLKPRVSRFSEKAPNFESKITINTSFSNSLVHNFNISEPQISVSPHNVIGQPLLKNVLPAISFANVTQSDPTVIAAAPVLLNVPPPQIVQGPVSNTLILPSGTTNVLVSTPTTVTIQPAELLTTTTLPPPTGIQSQNITVGAATVPSGLPTIELASIPPPNPIQVQNIPPPEPLNAINIPHPAPIQVQNIPTPSSIQLNEIPNPKPLDLLAIPTPKDDNSMSDPDFIKNIPPPNKSVPPPSLPDTNINVGLATPTILTVNSQSAQSIAQQHAVSATIVQNIPQSQTVMVHNVPPPSPLQIQTLHQAPQTLPQISAISVTLPVPVASTVTVTNAIPSLMAQPIMPPPGMGVTSINVSCPPPLLPLQPQTRPFINQPVTTTNQMHPVNVPPPTRNMLLIGETNMNPTSPFRDMNAGTPDYEAMASLGRMVAQCGPGIEDVVRQRKNQDPSLWFLFHKESAAYQQYLQLTEQFKRELNQESVNNVKVEPAAAEVKTEDVEIKQEFSEGNDKEIAGNKRKRRSRWGDKETNIPPPTVVMYKPPIDILPTGSVPLIVSPTNAPVMLSKVTRTDPGLLQYAMNTFGSTNLTEEDWKKAEDHYKINLLYQDMVRKREEVEKLKLAGKNKYDYDSDEETDGGTWEHKLREKEMMATQLWAQELTRQAEGKHHIGDFLPPEEFKRFMEKSTAAKEGRQLNFSDYKEFKIKEDNIGFKMLQKLGWSEGEGLGSGGKGIVEPVNKGPICDHNQGLGLTETSENEDEYESYRKRMMLAYRFRPNPLNNPRRPYY